MASPVVAALDADGDGEVSAKELENATAALKTLDKDKDGKLSAAELRPALGRGAGGTEAMVAEVCMPLDKDNDAARSARPNSPERLQAMMDRGDANKDGFLDKEELAKLTPPAGRGGARWWRRSWGVPEAEVAAASNERLAQSDTEIARRGRRGGLISDIIQDS